jgi:uncharacterized membrane protein YGL010W
VTPTSWSFLVWGIWFVATLSTFLVLEIPAAKDYTAWNTLTWTIRQLFARSQLIGLVFVGWIAVFVTHLFWKRSGKDEPEGDRDTTTKGT